MAAHLFVRTVLISAALLAGIPAAAQPAAAPVQPPRAAAVPQSPGPHGVRNFTQVDATFACGGMLSKDSMVSLEAAGFVTVVNLRAASEEGANVDAEREAAKAAGIRYAHLPFVSASPDATKVDEFLKIVSDPARQPVLLHCNSGARAAMFWAIKRVLIDGWPVEQAMSELPDLSKNASDALKKFTLEYLKSHVRG